MSVEAKNKERKEGVQKWGEIIAKKKELHEDPRLVQAKLLLQRIITKEYLDKFFSDLKDAKTGRYSSEYKTSLGRIFSFSPLDTGEGKEGYVRALQLLAKVEHASGMEELNSIAEKASGNGTLHWIIEQSSWEDYYSDYKETEQEGRIELADMKASKSP